jgi:serine protease inhibitor ecotin
MKKTILSSVILVAYASASAYAKETNCNKEILEAAKSKAPFAKNLVSMKRVYGPTNAGDEVYLVELETKQTMSDGIDTDLVSVSLWSDQVSRCNIQESAVMISHRP